ncbi:MAG: dTDP-4-dehydrorhamnose 3,5-epimerase-like enzyme [Planctomycetota bacterium]|jgi:dTDP-4-dehydrorhamnose 3,5-epimerase-like enzyme
MNHQKISIATSDERGSISDILYKADINHVAIIETHQGGVIRGNHYHKMSTQHIFMTKGSLRYWYQPTDKNQPVQSVLVKEYELVSTPPFEVHALEMIECSQFIVFSYGLRGGEDYEKDTFRDIVILTPGMLEK